MKNKQKLILVEWIDSCTTDNDWKDTTKSKGVAECISVGFLVKKTKEYIILFPNLTKDSNLGCNDITIPVGCIIKITKLNKSNGTTPKKK